MTNRRDFLELMGLGIAGLAGRSRAFAFAQSDDPELVVFNARVRTVDPLVPTAEAFTTEKGLAAAE